MKKIGILLLSILILSCNEDRLHDGYYKALIVNPNNMYDLNYEVLHVNGNTLLVSKYTFSGTFAGESRVVCKQFQDRVEFEDAASTQILRYNEVDSSLKLNDYVVYKYLGNSGEIRVTKSQANPLIRENKNGTITFLPEKGRLHSKEKIKVSNDYNEEEGEVVWPDDARTFCDKDNDWKIVFKIKNGDVTFTAFPGYNNTFYQDKSKPISTVRGFMQSGKFLDSIAQELNYSIKGNLLYEKNNEGRINEYFEKSVKVKMPATNNY